MKPWRDQNIIFAYVIAKSKVAYCERSHMGVLLWDGVWDLLRELVTLVWIRSMRLTDTIQDWWWGFIVESGQVRDLPDVAKLYCELSHMNLLFFALISRNWTLALWLSHSDWLSLGQCCSKAIFSLWFMSKSAANKRSHFLIWIILTIITISVFSLLRYLVGGTEQLSIDAQPLIIYKNRTIFRTIFVPSPTKHPSQSTPLPQTTHPKPSLPIPIPIATNPPIQKKQTNPQIFQESTPTIPHKTFHIPSILNETSFSYKMYDSFMSGITDDLKMSNENTNCIFPSFEDIQEGIESEYMARNTKWNRTIATNPPFNFVETSPPF